MNFFFSNTFKIQKYLIQFLPSFYISAKLYFFTQNSRKTSSFKNDIKIQSNHASIENLKYHFQQQFPNQQITFFSYCSQNSYIFFSQHFQIKGSIKKEFALKDIFLQAWFNSKIWLMIQFVGLRFNTLSDLYLCYYYHIFCKISNSLKQTKKKMHEESKLLNNLLNLPELNERVYQNPVSLQNKQLNFGVWQDLENLKYVVFLQKNKNKFACRLKKRKIRLFEQMSKFIGTRSTIQCRTHHQKYENKLGSTKAIIEQYKAHIGIKKFKKIAKQINKGNYIQKMQLDQWKFKDQKTLCTTQKSIDVGVQTDLTGQEKNQENADLLNQQLRILQNSYNLIPIFFYF